MARPTTMIPIQTNQLRKALADRDRSIASLEALLGVSRQAVNGWFQRDRIPPRKLADIARDLNITEEEFEAITMRQKDSLVPLFKIERNKKAEDQIKQTVLSVAKDFFFLHEKTSLNNPKGFVLIESDDPTVMAELILRELKLSREQLTLGSVIQSLESLDIHVVFYDFGKEFVDKKARAASIRKDKKSIIFINAHEAIEDVLSRIIHEACHLFSGHSEHLLKYEKFCDATAKQTIAPSTYFHKNKDMLKSAFAGPIQKTPLLVREIASSLGAAYLGVVLSLKENGIISKSVERYLFAVYHKTAEKRVRVIDVIQDLDQDPFDFLLEALADPDKRKFFKLHTVVKNALILDKISIGRAAELLNVDSATAEELSVLWKNQNEK